MRIRTAVVVAVLALACAACTSAGGSAPRTAASSASSTSSVSASSTGSSSPVSSRSAKTPATSGNAAQAGFPVARAQAAVAYARAHDMDSGVAVIDTRTGALTVAGDVDRLMPTASVAKFLIATQVLLQGQMHGHTEDLAYTMITRSDNDDAYALYPQVGADDVLSKVATHYGIDDLGERPAYAGFWGSTRVTARGLVKLYAAVRKDPKVWPWLSNAMHHHQPTTTGGEPNGFGLAALDDTAVKNGWNTERDKTRPRDCQINTTGYVDDDRYAVVVLSEGPGSLYYAGGERIVTKQAHLLFPDR